MTTPMPTGNEPPLPPDTLTLADLENDHTVLLAKERADGDAVRSLGSMSVLSFKPVLLLWYAKGCPPAYPIYQLPVSPPLRCSDGVVRTLSDYIEFCSGTTMREQIALLQQNLPDIQVSFANLQGSVALVVSTA